MRKLYTAVPRPWLLACAVLCVVALTHNLTGYALFDPDEGRNAEVAREMAEAGDYVLPHLNGLPYLDKPMLYFAVGAVTMKILGPTVLAARLPSLIFTFGTMFVVAWFARRIFGKGAAVPAAIATAATPFTLAYARIVIFDSALAFFVVAALVAFYLAIEERIVSGQVDRRTGEPNLLANSTAIPPYRRTAELTGEGSSAIAWVAMAFGVLTKGPIAIALPILVALPFAIHYRVWRAVIDPVGIFLFCAIVAPWVVAVSLKIPDFLEYALITETAGRFSTTDLGRTGPFWYFLAILPAAALPWSLSLAGSFGSGILHRDQTGRMDRRFVYLALWIVLPLIFFTLSQSKRPQYILPIIPAIALWVVGAWHVASARNPGARWGAIGLVIIGVFLAVANDSIPQMVPASPGIAAAIPQTATFLGTACIVAGLLAWLSHRHRDLLCLAFTLPIAAIPLSSHTLMKEIGNERSSELLAAAISSAAGDSVRVIGVGVFPPSLPFYMNQTIIVATEDGTELTSNYLSRHVQEYRGFGFPLRRADWWQEALITCSVPTVFVASSADTDTREALSQLNVVMATSKYVAYGPCGSETLALRDY